MILAFISYHLCDKSIVIFTYIKKKIDSVVLQV